MTWPDFAGREPALVSSSTQSRMRARSRFGLHLFFHETPLVQKNLQEELCEVEEGLLAQSAAAIKLVAARRVAFGQVFLVGADSPGKPPSD